MPHPTLAISQVVSDLYNRYPFPQVDGLGRYLQGDFLRSRWNYMLRRRAKDVLPARMKIWIAGCGTRHAVYVAMNFPEAQVLATDLSDSSLKIASNLAKTLELRNLTLRREDLTQTSYKEEFDMIQCYGVLHCLQDPLAGFRLLRRALKPDGAASIMLYNIRHRHLGMAFQKSVDILTAHSHQLEKKQAIAFRLIETLKQSSACEEMKRFLSRFEWEKDIPRFADTLLHPREVAYGIDELFALIDDAGFRLAGWLHPEAWDLSDYIDDQEILGMFRKLDERSRDRLVYFLLGEQSPIFEFYVEKDDAGGHPPYREEEFLELRPVAKTGMVQYCMKENQIECHHEHPAYSRGSDGLLHLTLIDTDRTGIDIALPSQMEPFFRACDGAATIRELLERFDGEHPKHDLIAFFSRMLSSRFAMLAPRYPPPPP